MCRDTVGDAIIHASRRGAVRGQLVRLVRRRRAPAFLQGGRRAPAYPRAPDQRPYALPVRRRPRGAYAGPGRQGWCGDAPGSFSSSSAVLVSALLLCVSAQCDDGGDVVTAGTVGARHGTAGYPQRSRGLAGYSRRRWSAPCKVFWLPWASLRDEETHFRVFSSRRGR